MIGYKENRNKIEAGFTILEMVVVIGIFSVVLIMIIGITTRFTSLQRSSISEQNLQSDLRFAMELFNREVRTGFGSTYDSIGGTGQNVVFRNQNNDCVQYRFNNNTLERAEIHSGNIAANQTCSSLTYPNNRFSSLVKGQTLINAENSRFFPVRSQFDDNNQLTTQGFIMIEISARTRNGSVPIVNLRSAVTSRQVISFQSLLGENN